MTTAARLAHADPIYGRIWRAIPRTVEPMLREDIMSDLYLAIREGRLHPRNIEAEAKQFVTAAYSVFANRFRYISLDAPRGEDGEITLLDTLADQGALLAFDRIEFGRAV